ETSQCNNRLRAVREKVKKNPSFYKAKLGVSLVGNDVNKVADVDGGAPKKELSASLEEVVDE
ncbi:unnamed protein product, partial [Ilex paraguariensis]